jgi:hypothetical protein
VNSANVTGGIPPTPLHDIWPVPQSPVAQVNLPVVSVEHCDLAQNLPIRIRWSYEFSSVGRNIKSYTEPVN